MESNRMAIQTLLYNITWLRRKHGLTKVEMAGILGVGLHTLNKIEAGTLPPRLGCQIFHTVYRNFGILPSALICRRLDS